MGRPKGSRNKTHKRKYTRRTIVHDLVPSANGADVEARALCWEIKKMIAKAPPAVARKVIGDLTEDLALMSQILEG